MSYIPKDQRDDIVNDPIQYLLWSQRLKATKQRIAITKILSDEACALSIDTLRRKLPNISLTCFYRTLKTLIDAGIVRKINMSNLSGSKTGYEVSFGNKHHHHIICTRCGDIEDIKKCPAKSLSKYLADSLKKFKLINDHSLEYFGICNKCLI